MLVRILQFLLQTEYNHFCLRSKWNGDESFYDSNFILFHLTMYILSHHLENLNDMTTYSPCDNIYTIRFLKFALDHKIDPLYLTYHLSHQLLKYNTPNNSSLDTCFHKILIVQKFVKICIKTTIPQIFSKQENKKLTKKIK